MICTEQVIPIATLLGWISHLAYVTIVMTIVCAPLETSALLSTVVEKVASDDEYS